MESIEFCRSRNLLYVLPYDRREHERSHKNFIKLQEKFGKDNVIHYKEREALEVKGWEIVNNSALSLSDRIAGAEMAFRCWFARSVLADATLKHPTLEIYISMLLNQMHVMKMLPQDVYKAMILKYGTRPGIPEGKSYWYPLRRI